jgi:GDP-L-fucose synthase
MISKDSKIYIAGHNGMVGSAILRKLKNKGFKNLIFKNSKELDLRIQKNVDEYISHEKPKIIIDAAAIVGGIWANNEYRYRFLMDNMLIQNNLINASIKSEIRNFIFLGSSCIYPKLTAQPMKEEALLTGSLEETNQWYAIAKISGVKLVDAIRRQFGYNYVSLMPTNLYGPNDNYNLKTSHVLPALIRKIHEAKMENKDVELWGTGKSLREFLHVDDLAEAVLLIINTQTEEYLYNIGSGIEITIESLAKLIKGEIGFTGNIIYNSSFPDGTPRKLLDSSKINKLGWKPKISLEDGIKITYEDFLENSNI